MAGNTTIQYATTGSNTAASGCGPGDDGVGSAITGTNAAYSGDGAGGGTQTVITFTNTPDLSAVQVDDILYLNTGAGERYLFEITAVNDGADTVTVQYAPDTAINSGSAVSYAIGGVRAGPKRSGTSSTEFDFIKAQGGWIFEFEDGNYDITLTTSGGTIFLATDGTGTGDTDFGKIIVRSKAYAADPYTFDADNCAVFLEWDQSIADGSAENFYCQMGQWCFEGVGMGPDSTGTGSTLNYIAGALIYYHKCLFKNDQVSGGYSVRYANFGINDLFFDCVFQDNVRFDKSFNNGDSFFFRCRIRTTNGFLYRPHNNVTLFWKCVFTAVGGNPPIYSQAANYNGTVLLLNCTCFNSNGSVVDWNYSTPNNPGAHVILGNSISSAGGFGLDYYSAAMWDLNPYYLHDYNHFHNNTSGDRSDSEPAGPNDVTGDPLFKSTTGGSEDLRPNPGSPLIGGGFPPLIR